MIKLFEQFNNEQEIIEICEKYKIKNYTINPDGSIDVNGNVKLSCQALNSLPLKFNKVSGYFYINDNFLTNLNNCPKEVGGEFDCSGNNLTSLEGGPELVGGDYDCSFNRLTSLEGSPMDINGSLKCAYNTLKTLKGSPLRISSDFILKRNPIKIIDSSIEFNNININDTEFPIQIQLLNMKKLRIVFEHGVDYDIFKSDGSFNYKRLERMFKDFE